MGCVNTKADINDTHPNIFEVMNIDELGHLLSPGQLEITETELILYQKGKMSTNWPLRSLRKYGFDFEIFSFECGRRCPTGPGIYAFRCVRAEQLFNLVQQNIQLRNINEDRSVFNEFSVPLISTGPPVQQRPSQTLPEGYLNPTNAVVNVRKPPSLSRPGSLNSNGPNSPATPPLLSPQPDLLSEHNNNKQNLISLPEHSYTNILNEQLANDISNASSSTTTTSGIVSVSETLTDNHCYMNVDTNEMSHLNTKELPNNLTSDLELKPTFDFDETKRSYANIDVNDCLRSLFNQSVEMQPILSPTIPETPNYVTVVREVNYVELDLVPSKETLQVTPDSPNKPNKSYVTIDFIKSNALSQSVNPSMEVEEGSRKTRHNSTISDIITRHSNSLSD